MSITSTSTGTAAAHLESERAEIRALAGELARRELVPRALSLDEGADGAFADSWRQLTETGLDRALVGADAGGAGLDRGALLDAISELAAGEGGVALSALLSNAAIMALGPERAAAVPPGSRWAAVVAWPGEVEVAGDRLAGRIASALGAHGADGLLLALAGPEPAAFALEATSDGLEVRPDEAQLGLRAASAAEVSVDGIEAGPHRVECDVSDLLTFLRAGTAAVARGIARRAYEMALDYAHERQQGGVPIIEHDAVSDMLGSMAVRLAEPAPCPTSPAAALAAKIAESDAAVATTTDAVQVFGGTGYMHETGIEKQMRDAKYCQLFPESNWIARDELMRLERAAHTPAP